MKIEEAFTKISAGEKYTAADMKRHLFPKTTNRPGHFKLEKLEHSCAVVQLEMALDADNAEILYQILAIEFHTDALSVKKLSASRYLTKERDFPA